ncbi:MAG: PAS domain-containing protein [Methanospirillum sp.]|nr:PAS domain-containing protein [Methanospirillum sp.]
MPLRVPDVKSHSFWLVIIILTTVLAYIICTVAISRNIHTVVSHLFYIPVILACWRFPRGGIGYSLVIATGYVCLEVFYPSVNVSDLDAVLRGVMFMIVGSVVAWLSYYLHSQRESFERLLSSVDTGVLLVHPTGTILYVNRYAQSVLDRRGGDVTGTELTAYARDPGIVSRFLADCAGKNTCEDTLELQLIRRDGYPVPVHLFGYCEKEGNITVTLTDLSEEKWMAHERATDRKIMKVLLDAIPEGIFLADTRGSILEVNKTCEELTGWKEGGGITRPTTGTWDDSASKQIHDAVLQSVHEKDTCNVIITTPLENQSRHFEICLTPVPDDTGGITRIAGIIRDITSREEYLQQIREREGYLRTVLDGLPLATVVIDPTHHVLTVNQALSMLFERDVGDIIGTDTHPRLLYPLNERPLLCDILIEDDVDLSLNRWYEGLYAPSPTVPGAYECIDFYPHIGEAGKWIRSTAARIVDEKGVTIGAVETFEDFSSQKMADDILRISEERFKIASHIATDLIFEYEQPSDRIQWFGDVEKWLGLDSVARVTSLTGWVSLLHPDDIARIKTSFIHHVLTGDPITEELRIKHRNGQYQTWIIKAVALYDNNFHQIKTIGVVSDISEMRATEEAKKKALVAIERYIEQFAVLNDHIRNPLQAIAGYNDLQKGEYEKKIAEQVHQVNAIIDQLDRGWIESESIRDFLRRHYGITIKKDS